MDPGRDSAAVLVSAREIYRGRVLRLVVERVRLPHGREVDLEVVRHPASVVLLPMPDPEHVVLVRQYRYAIDRWVWELPAGSLDGDEDAESAARRECHEEIGLVPRHIQRLGAFYPTPGYCDEQMIFFRLTGLEAPERSATQDDDEQLEPRVFSVAGARRLVEAGEIIDMKTVVGLGMI